MNKKGLQLTGSSLRSFSGTTFRSLRRPEDGYSGFTLVELLVSIGIVVVLVMLLLPASNRVLSWSKKTACTSNLHQIGLAIRLYQVENNGSFPQAYTGQLYWFHQLANAKYLTNTKVFACPNYSTTPAWGISPAVTVGYGMTDLTVWSPSSHRTDDDASFAKKLVRASGWPLVMDADSWILYSLDNPSPSSDSHTRFAARHDLSANVLMADGHIESAQYGDNRWSQSALNNNSF